MFFYGLSFFFLENMSQFGLLELSESQGLNIESGDDVKETPANLQPADSQKTANQSKSKSPVHTNSYTTSSCSFTDILHFIFLCCSAAFKGSLKASDNQDDRFIR